MEVCGVGDGVRESFEVGGVCAGMNLASLSSAYLVCGCAACTLCRVEFDPPASQHLNRQQTRNTTGMSQHEEKQTGAQTPFFVSPERGGRLTAGPEQECAGLLRGQCCRIKPTQENEHHTCTLAGHPGVNPLYTSTGKSQSKPGDIPASWRGGCRSYKETYPSLGN